MQVIDFMKLSNFRGLLNYDFDFKEDKDVLDRLHSSVSMINAKLLANGYQRMTRFEYIKFMEYMKVHPIYNYNQYIVV